MSTGANTLNGSLKRSFGSIATTHVNKVWSPSGDGKYGKNKTVVISVQFTEPGKIPQELKRLARKISKAWAEVLAMDAPEDTGALKRAIKPVDPDDAILDQETDELDALELEY